MTVFATLTMILIFGFLAALLEAGRMEVMKQVAVADTQRIAETVFSSYVCPMWEEYGLLLLDEAESDYLFQEKSKYLESSGEKNNLLHMKLDHVEMKEPLYATDQEGRAFLSLISSYMRKRMVAETLTSLKNQYEGTDTVTTDEINLNSFDLAQKAVEDAKAAEGEEVSPEKKENVENPIEYMKLLLTKGYLSLVGIPKETLSKKKIDKKTCVSERKLKKGSRKTDLNLGPEDRMLWTEYMKDYFGDYLHPKKTRDLSYELEYILCGKARDSDNLSGAVTKLIGIRQGPNLLYLQTDAEKKAIAAEIAASIVTVTLTPSALLLVTEAVLNAWALAESIVDVSLLVDGKKVAWVKTKENWRTDIYHLGKSLSNTKTLKGDENGGDYSFYLKALLMLLPEKDISYRSMDLMELEICKRKGYRKFAFDRQIVDATFVASYGYKSIFLGMDALTKGKKESFKLRCVRDFSYRKAGV